MRAETIERESAKLRGASDINSLVALIPEGREVFAYPVTFKTLKRSRIVEEKVKPWIDKKVADFGFSNEQRKKTVADKVFQAVQRACDSSAALEDGDVLPLSERDEIRERDGSRREPSYTTQDMLVDLKPFLNQDTEKFCIKMWRCIILYYLSYKKTHNLV